MVRVVIIASICSLLGACGLSREPRSLSSRDASIGRDDSGIETDAGTSDSGVPDGGTVDSGLPDAGMPDGGCNGPELCDGFDNDCDPTTPDGADEPTLIASCDGSDGDTCDDDVIQCVDGALQCVDQPSPVEICGNSIDDDCDGTIDESEGAMGTTVHFRDVDGDGYGDPGASAERCSPGDGFVSNNVDCDDRRSYVNPGSSEACGTLDEDCDGAIDEGDVCPCRFGSELDGVIYRQCAARGDWGTAQARCADAGGSLLGEHNAMLRAHIRDSLRALPASTPSWYWIGARDVVTEGEFRWTNGDAVVDTHWASNQPNDDVRMDDEDCVAVFWDSGNWADADCSENIGAVCQFPIRPEDAP